MDSVEKYYSSAKGKYSEIGINTDDAIKQLKKLVFSLKCSDVVNVEDKNETSDYVSEKSNSPKLRYGLENAFQLIPGKHRVALSAVNMDAIEYVEMDEIEACHYDIWIEWAKKHTAGMDFYTSMARHEKSDKGFALSNRNKDIRYFWVEHCQRCRIVGQHIGSELKSPCLTTININDYYQSVPIECISTQGFLVDSLNKIYSEDRNRNYIVDTISTSLKKEQCSKMPVVNDEFCTNYAIDNNLFTCIDSQSLNSVQDIYHRLAAVIPFAKRIVLNIQPEKASDNVILLSSKLINLAKYIVNNNLMDKVSICLDFKTDADDLSKVKKWVIGTRNVQKAFLLAFLEPGDFLKKCDEAGDYISKAALMEEFRTYPFGAVWDYFCKSMDVPVGVEWLESGNHINE